MAWKRRIRYQLFWSMALAIGIMALLVGTTVKGLYAYKETFQAVDSKFDEYNAAIRVREKIREELSRFDKTDSSKSLTDPTPNEKNDVPRLIQEPISNGSTLNRPARLQIAEIDDALKNYEDRLRETVRRHLDSDDGKHEQGQVKKIRNLLTELQATLKVAPLVQIPGNHNAAETPATKVVLNELAKEVGDLVNTINDKISHRYDTSKKAFRIAVAYLLVSSIVAILAIALLLRSLYRSVAIPVSALEVGVERITKGDFAHRIHIHSGDEFQELGDAYNVMSDRLREMYDNLAEQVNERSRQLVRSERLAGVGFLAAGVAHEINNPLASIAFCSEALDSRLAELLQRLPGAIQEREVISKYLRMIHEEAFRCKEITQKLLAFSRGGGERRREQTDLVEVIQGVLDMVQHLQNSKGRTVVFRPTERLLVWINAQEVKQVFLNLVVNALENMDEGGTLTIAHARQDDMIELSFRDTGCGMTPDVLENIFEPFFTRSRTGKGTGLGLSISHRIITQHGGEIFATSAGPNQGSTFIVRLPTEMPAEMPTDDEGDVLDPEQEFLKLSATREKRRAA